MLKAVEVWISFSAGQEFKHLIWADWTVGCYLYWHGTMWRINQTIPVYFCCWCWQTLVLTDWLHNDWGQWGGPGDKFLHFHTMEEWRGGGGVFVRCCYNTSYWIIVCLLVFYWPELSSSGAWYQQGSRLTEVSTTTICLSIRSPGNKLFLCWDWRWGDSRLSW